MSLNSLLSNNKNECFRKYDINIATKKNKPFYNHSKRVIIRRTFIEQKKYKIYKTKVEICHMVYAGETRRSVEFKRTKER